MFLEGIQDYIGLIVGVTIGIVVLIIVISISSYIINTRNYLKKTEIKCDEALSGIDVALTKRFDLLTKSIEVVKGYSKHETDTLTKVIGMRSGIDTRDTIKAETNGGLKLSSLNELQDMASKLSEATKQLNIVIEKYPELKANEQFNSLSSQIDEVEEHLQASRRLYNSNVSELNQKIVSFPSNIIANKFHVVEREMFKAEEAKKQDVKISL